MDILKLTPACKSYIWGGRRLIENYSKLTDEETLSETWELSFHPDGPSLADGVPLSELVTDKELGKNTNTINEDVKRTADELINNIIPLKKAVNE